MKPPYAIGSVPSLSGHAIAYRRRSLPRVRRDRASKPQGSSERVLPWQITMDQCVAPVGTSNELDVQNEWEENTKHRKNTHTLRYILTSRTCLKKNQNTPRPSEHPPVREGKCQNV